MCCIGGIYFLVYLKEKRLAIIQSKLMELKYELLAYELEDYQQF